MEKVVQVPTIEPTEKKEPVLKKFDSSSPKKSFFIPFFIGVFVIFAGLGSGWGIVKVTGSSNSAKPKVEAGDKKVNGKNEEGIADESTFKDTAEGVLKEGGINGEGTYHLDRDLGETKYVYLTSTAVDMQKYVGKKVQVWGQTIAGQKAGWLMDVGRIKILE
jgi:hypothetical protein